MYQKGEEIVVAHKGRPVAKLVPLVADDIDTQELELVAAGKMRLPEAELDVEVFLRMPTARIRGASSVQALLDDREESL